MPKRPDPETTQALAKVIPEERQLPPAEKGALTTREGVRLFMLKALLAAQRVTLMRWVGQVERKKAAERTRLKLDLAFVVVGVTGASIVAKVVEATTDFPVNDPFLLFSFYLVPVGYLTLRTKKRRGSQLPAAPTKAALPSPGPILPPVKPDDADNL